MAFNLTYKPYGERSILIEWPSVINKKVLSDTLSFKKRIATSNIQSIININSSYNSLLITYNFFEFEFNKLKSALKDIYLQKEGYAKSVFRQWKIPVCYGEHFGIDLEEISLNKNISKEEIIKRHSQANYTVYFIGFLPGFLYLGGLDESLHVPRKQTPRLRIDKGAVAIGGKQTGVYPSESPGGWNIIGNTPISFFDASKSNPCFASANDKIQFYLVSLKEYHNIKVLNDAGVYQLESEVIDD